MPSLPHDISDLTLADLADLLASLAIPASRASHLFREIYLRGHYDFADMPGLKGVHRVRLAEKCSFCRLLPAKVETAADGTRKFAFRLHDGALIESVLIPQQKRLTLCVSSQVGCAMGCGFCVTATMGFRRNLRPGEIVGQVLAVIDHLIQSGVERSTRREFINNLVFMGMGEPLANYDNVLKALKILMAPEGLEFTRRQVTVSTCGLVPQIIALGRDARVNLAISLHAANDQTRDRLMPVNSRYPLAELLAACRAFPLARKRVILMEYILLRDINDSPTDAQQLAALLKDIPCRVNLLPYNESCHRPFQRPPEETIQTFKKILYQAGIRAFVRESRGADISAACGQLAADESPLRFRQGEQGPAQGGQRCHKEGGNEQTLF